MANCCCHTAGRADPAQRPVGCYPYQVRIGLFTDSYHPASNGVVVIVDATRRQLEELGHEVYIFAPDGGVLTHKQPHDPHVIRMPAFQYDMQLSLFFPPWLLAKVARLHLDVIEFFTPAQLGLTSVLAARLTHAALVGKHSTDTYEFSKNYKAMAISYVFAGLLAPTIVKPTPHRLATYLRLYLTPQPRPKGERWSQHLVAGLMAMLYASCDAVIAVSDKSADQLTGFADRIGETLPICVLPDGIDVLAPPQPGEVETLRSRWGIEPDDEVVVNFGRMAEEKNQVLLINMMPRLVKQRPHVKLVLAGDYVFRGRLEALAAASPVSDRIIFTGPYERRELGAICAISQVFAFPSLTDTQGIVLNEAAGLGLPIVMCDQHLNDVFVEGQNGLLANNDPTDFAKAVARLLADDQLRTAFSERGRQLAAQFTERHQAEKLAALFEQLPNLRGPKCASR